MHPLQVDRCAPASAGLSRRAALGRLGGGGLAAALAGTALVRGRISARLATPATIPPLVTEWAAAQTNHDPDRFVALCTDDVTHEEVVAGFVPVHGKEELRVYLAGLFAAFPDVTVVPETGFVAETWGAVQWTFAGTRTGATSPVGETDTSYALRGASLWELEGGKIRRSTGYYDLFTILVQLGAITPPAATPTP
jgi:steroid delta-isomerase-like uncharacterized protein